MSIDIRHCSQLVVDGVDARDYPDFVDAYFAHGKIGGRDLTYDELDYLTENYPEVVNEAAIESLL